MVHRLPVHLRRPAGSRHVRRAQRQVQHKLAEIRLITRHLQVLGHPLQPVPQLHGAACRVEPVAVIVVPRNHRENGLQVRIVEHRHLPLHDPQVRTAHHADLAVRPRLARDPVQRVVAVRRLLFERLERALRFVTPAHVFHHHRVAVVHEGLVIRRDASALPVRRAHQNGRHSGILGGQKNVGRQVHSVAHRNRHAQLLDRGPLPPGRTPASQVENQAR